MAKWKLPALDGIGNPAKFKFDKFKMGSLSPVGKVGQQLKKLGMTDTGIRQLSAGQSITDKNDQAIVASIVTQALG